MAHAAQKLCESPNALISEKRVGRRITFRLSGSLREFIERNARQNGMTISDYLVHVAAMRDELQAADGRTWSDKLHQLRLALELVEKEDDDLTAPQKVWILIRLTSVQQMILAGKRR